jgi:ADP-heptose:LPS heptosyltransferase
MAKKILIFAQGTIGDMVTAMPAMKRLRDFHRGDELHLHNTYPGTNDCHRTLFDHLGWFEKMRFTNVEPGLFSSPFRRFGNWCALFAEHYDVIYELPNNRLSPKWLLRAFGAKKLVALDKIEPDGVPRSRFLLDFLAANGIPRVPGDEHIDFAFTPEEKQRADAWFDALPIPDGKTPFALCVGGKNPLQHWPLDRYAAVLKDLLREKPLFPVVFGSIGERGDAKRLIRECGCGVFSQDMEPLTLREMIPVLSRCRFYFGNDTGIMHLAGAAGIPIIGICSARAPHNYWRPLSDSVQLLAADIPCRGCRATVCRMGELAPCIDKVGVDRVMVEIRKLLGDE